MNLTTSFKRDAAQLTSLKPEQNKLVWGVAGEWPNYLNMLTKYYYPRR